MVTGGSNDKGHRRLSRRPCPPSTPPARRATEWLDALAETWQKTDLVQKKSDVIHAVYERIVIEGPRFDRLRLTPAAYRH